MSHDKDLLIEMVNNSVSLLLDVKERIEDADQDEISTHITSMAEALEHVKIKAEEVSGSLSPNLSGRKQSTSVLKCPKCKHYINARVTLSP